MAVALAAREALLAHRGAERHTVADLVARLAAQGLAYSAPTVAAALAEVERRAASGGGRGEAYPPILFDPDEGAFYES